MYSHKVKEKTATPDKYPQGYFKPKACRECGTEFQPVAPSHLYCSDSCFVSARINKYLTRTYGVTYEWYKQQLDKQNHVCAICSQPGFTMTDNHELKLVVDHCHTNGNVRGLLCHNCNRALGLLKDNTSVLAVAIKYLESSETISQESTPKWVEAPSPL